MLGKLTREDEPDGGLDLAGGDGGAVVVLGQLGSLERETVKDVRDEGVEDGHRAGGDTGVVVDLLEDLVDVRGVSLLALRRGLLLHAE